MITVKNRTKNIYYWLGDLLGKKVKVSCEPSDCSRLWVIFSQWQQSRLSLRDSVYDSGCWPRRRWGAPGWCPAHAGRRRRRADTPPAPRVLFEVWGL